MIEAAEIIVAPLRVAATRGEAPGREIDRQPSTAGDPDLDPAVKTRRDLAPQIARDHPPRYAARAAERGEQGRAEFAVVPAVIQNPVQRHRRIDRVIVD